VWWYHAAPGQVESGFGPGFAPAPCLQTTATQIKRINQGYFDLFLKAQRVREPVGIYYSETSRLFSGDCSDFNEHAWDVHNAIRILENYAGYPFRLVAPDEICEGKLKDCRLLLLPLTQTVSEREAAALAKFVQGGGVLVADVRPGLADERGKIGNAVRLNDLFGLAFDRTLGRKMVCGSLSGHYENQAFDTGTVRFPVDPALRLRDAAALATVEGVPVFTVKRSGLGVAICLDTPFNYYRGTPIPTQLYAYFGLDEQNALISRLLLAILHAHGIERPVQLDFAEGAGWLWGLEVGQHVDGKARYINLTKKRATSDEPEHVITVHAPELSHVYDMLDGAYLGRAQEWKAALKPGGVKVYSILPYELKNLKVRVKTDKSERGGEIAGVVALETGGIKPVRHVIHLEVTRPDGQVVRYMAGNLETDDGEAEFSVPVALNEPEGAFVLSFTDAATGISTKVQVQVR
jgi:hypothetical protein